MGLFGKKVKYYEHEIKEVKLERLSTDDSEIKNLADNLVNSIPILIDFSHLDEDSSNKAAAFLSGVAYALLGDYYKIGKQVYLFVDEVANNYNSVKRYLHEKEIL